MKKRKKSKKRPHYWVTATSHLAGEAVDQMFEDYKSGAYPDCVLGPEEEKHVACAFFGGITAAVRSTKEALGLYPPPEVYAVLQGFSARASKQALQRLKPNELLQ